MLLEGDVLNDVSRYVEARGYSVEQQLSTKQTGYDLIARSCDDPNRLLIVEAKGETSSNPNSKRFGQPFESADVTVNVAEAVLAAMRVVSLEPVGDHVVRLSGIALPDNKVHRKQVEAVLGALNRLCIIVFWVSSSSEVIVDSRAGVLA